MIGWNRIFEMSRRSRRKRGGAKGPWLGKAVVAFGVVLLLGLAVAYAGLRVYLHSEGFRKFLSAQASGAAKVRGEFSPFLWDGLAVETGGFDATGTGMIGGLMADQISTEIGFGGVGRGVWELKDTRITRLEVILNPGKADEPPPVSPELHKKAVVKKQPGWVPKKVELESLQIGELAVGGALLAGPVEAGGMAVHVVPGAGHNGYKGEITGGYVDLPQKWVPQLRVNRVAGTFQDGSAFITKADIGAWREGRITAFGEWNKEDGYYSFEGDLEGIRSDEILNENWARKISGDLSSGFSIDNQGGSMVMAGEMELRNGTMTALPMLDALAAYADTRRFRVIQLNEARTKWRYTKEEMRLTDFVMGSEGLIRLEGNMLIKGQALDGRFRLGIVPGVLSNIPGAETHVFRPGEMGLLWTDIHITGTVDDPEEDLTVRLIEAAGLRMFEQLPESGEKVLKFTRSVLGESPSEAIDKGKMMIKEGEDVVREAKGIFKELLGD